VTLRYNPREGTVIEAAPALCDAQGAFTLDGVNFDAPGTYTIECRSAEGGYAPATVSLRTDGKLAEVVLKPLKR